MKSFNFLSTRSVLEAENATTLFKKQATVPIIVYLTLQNFLVTTVVAAFASGLYYSYAISANRKSAEYTLGVIQNITMVQQGFSCEEVMDELEIFLSEPENALRSSAEMFSSGFLDLHDWSQLNRWFFGQIQMYPMLSKIVFVEYPSSDAFGIAAYGDEESKTYELQLSNANTKRLCPVVLSVDGFCQTTSGYVTAYPTSNENVIDLAGATSKISLPMFGSPHPTGLGAYAMTDAPKDVVSWFPSIKVTDAEKGILSLAFFYPMWANGTFLGTFMGQIDFGITHNLLRHLQEEATQQSIIYFFQRDELMVGTSTNESIAKIDSLGMPYALTVAEMTDPFIRFTQDYIRSQYNGSFSSVPNDALLNSRVTDPSTGNTYMFQFSALNPGTNLEFLVIVGAPEGDYTGSMIAVQNAIFGELQNSNRNVLILIFSIQFVMMLGTISLLWLRVVKPLRTLVIGMNKGKDFQFTSISDYTSASNPSSVTELYSCQKAFFDMIKRFAEAFKQSRNTQRQGPAAGSSGANKTSEQIPSPSTSVLPNPNQKTTDQLVGSAPLITSSQN